MMRNIDINSPDHRLCLGDFSNPEEIYYYFKSHGIIKYVYGIRCNSSVASIVVKYGRSGKAGGRNIPGERIRGQAAQLSGWTVNADDLRVGSEFNTILDVLQVRNKDFFELEIWDLTNEPNETFEPDYVIESAEGQLLTQFENHYRRLPLGNRRKEPKRAAVTKNTYHNVFEEL